MKFRGAASDTMKKLTTVDSSCGVSVNPVAMGSKGRKQIMSTILIEHVKVSDLPASWRARLAAATDAQVTVRIEEEPPAAGDASSAFGMWRDRDDLSDVAASARRLRAPRFEPG